MRKLLLPVMAAVAVCLLPACSGGNPPPSTPTESATTMPSESPSASTPPDAESTLPAPPPPSPTETPAGAGNAELSITVEPGEGAAAIHYTLVCEAGQAAAESSHPNASAACAALAAQPGMLHRKPDPNRICTEQWGGPQKATVTGVVDGVPVDAAFSRTDGCEISAWDAARDVLGAHGGAV
ncbi:SSI family serine proteinase inhibitor [Pseudarthrobacter sp. J75]|uniref:SSI family serine proteinase inhibitor n=2 Tax=unclassified Pseudarthrobacter TaxID=2647000 RepID=UPI002E812E6C|nr:SSI family serine proteinase inhibitor [Pseudarthrobacter sp. J47]MEE2522581.1 SSI family serine proteinase inhibitor [Pseudarthrobacter sp. J47]MEE2529074.1 SSI family serine proteinase inhibitor [Pseudarthrobacter sp. J75]